MTLIMRADGLHFEVFAECTVRKHLASALIGPHKRNSREVRDILATNDQNTNRGKIHNIRALFLGPVCTKDTLNSPVYKFN